MSAFIAGLPTWGTLIGLTFRRRPVFGNYQLVQTDPHWHDQLWFHEYFHGDTGAGLGASHQTGWTGLVAECILRRHYTAK